MSYGSKEREDTSWIYLAVPCSPRRAHEWRRAGYAPPEKSVMVILDPRCRRAKRRRTAQDLFNPRGKRARFFTAKGEPFIKEMANA